MILGVDTATRTASLALYDADGVHGETSWWARENHTVSLMPQLVQLLHLCRVELTQLQAIAVTTGPGSFTGLRIGLSVAKGLALALKIPLIGVPTLDASAHAFAQQPLALWAVLHAGRGRYAAAPFAVRAQRATRSADYSLRDAQGLAAEIANWSQGAGSERVLVCGELDKNLRNTLQAQMGGRALLASDASTLRRASYVAELGWLSWQSGKVDDLATLVPYYIPTASVPQAMGA